MALLELASNFVESYNLTKEIGENIYDSDHLEDCKTAANRYSQLIESKEDNENEVKDILRQLYSVDESDKTFVQTWANLIRAYCYYDLSQYEQAISCLSDILKADTDSLFTVNKDSINDDKRNAKDFLSTCVTVKWLLEMDNWDDKDVDVCHTAAKIFVENLVGDLCGADAFLDKIRTFSDLEIVSWQIPDILSELEEELAITINDDSLLGVSRSELEEDYEEEKKFNDVDIVDLLKEIKNINYPDSEKSDDDSLSTEEQEYLDMFQMYAEGEISERDRKKLDKFRISLGISEERAKELEESLLELELTDEEQKYLDLYKDCSIDGEISAIDRKLLDKMRASLGLSEERARELESSYLPTGD